jgi:hypothetical protein
MKFVILLALLFAVGCAGKEKEAVNTKPNGVQFRTDTNSSITRSCISRTTHYGMASDTPIRYFDFSYQVTGIDGITVNYGSVVMSSRGFPARTEVEGYVKKEKKLRHIQDIIVHPVFEFKDSNDFNNYLK